MPTYKAEPGTAVNGNDHQGNVWPKPYVFIKDTLTIPDDQQDVVAAFESAADAGAITRLKEPPMRSPNRKE